MRRFLTLELSCIKRPVSCEVQAFSNMTGGLLGVFGIAGSARSHPRYQISIKAIKYFKSKVCSLKACVFAAMKFPSLRSGRRYSTARGASLS